MTPGDAGFLRDANAAERQTHQRTQARAQAHTDTELAKSAQRSADAADVIAVAEAKETAANADTLATYTPYMIAAGLALAALFGAFLWGRK